MISVYRKCVGIMILNKRKEILELFYIEPQIIFMNIHKLAIHIKFWITKKLKENGPKIMKV